MVKATRGCTVSCVTFSVNGDCIFPVYPFWVLVAGGQFVILIERMTQNDIRRGGGEKGGRGKWEMKEKIEKESCSGLESV